MPGTSTASGIQMSAYAEPKMLPESAAAAGTPITPPTSTSAAQPAAVAAVLRAISSCGAVMIER